MSANYANGADEEQQAAAAYAAQLVNTSVVPMVLHTACELKLFEIIAKAGVGAGLSPSEIAAQLPTNQPDAPDMLDRMLYLLASHKILTCSSADDRHEDGNNGDGEFEGKKEKKNRVYGLTPVAKYFAPNKDGASYGPLLALLQDKVFVNSWYKLKDAVLEGGVPFDMVYGMNAFEYPGKDPRFNRVFNTAMLNHTTVVINEMVKAYDGFKQLEHKRLVDVGGGLGITSGIITSKYPAIKAINFDLPHVIEHATAYPGVQHVGGDMFESVPEGDAIFMKWILHDWSDDHCLKLLKNCFKALPETGKVIVAETTLPDIPNAKASTKAATTMDVLMMTQNPGGRERSEDEFLTLATKAGFSGVKIVLHCSGLFCLMEFLK